MKPLVRYSVFLVFAIFLIGCSPAVELTKDLQNTKCRMTYLHDKPVNKQKKDISVFIDSVNYNIENPIENTLVEKKRGIVIPFIFINYWNYKYECTLGNRNIEEEIPDFMRTSLMTEAMRTGTFLVSMNPSEEPDTEAEYNLNISLNAYKASGPYYYAGFFYWYVSPAGYGFGYYHKHKVKPAAVTTIVSMKLQRDGETLLEKEYSLNRASEIIPQFDRNLKILLANNYIRSMTEAFAINIKDISEAIVEDLNDYFNENEVERDYVPESLVDSLLIQVELMEAKTHYEVLLEKKEEIDNFLKDDESQNQDKDPLVMFFVICNKNVLEYIEGKIVGVEDSVIEIECDTTLYLVNKSLIFSVIDYRDKDITEKIKSFKKYVSYKKKDEYSEVILINE